MRYVFFFKDTATTEIYTLSLHDALPISRVAAATALLAGAAAIATPASAQDATWTGAAGNASWNTSTNWSPATDRKSTRLNSSHANISYAVFCLKKKNLTTHRLPDCHVCH